LLFLGVNGVIGGVLMLRDPNGSPMGMPVSYLARTPFQNWFVPGLWLILIWGSGSILALLGLWMHPAWSPLDRLTRWTHESWAWVLSVMLGMALLVWLTVQVFTLPEMAAIQYILYVLAALLVAVPLVPAMRRFYHL
jgi:hypothetical protein